MTVEFELSKLVRPNIQALKPYHSAREDFETGLLLDANENSQGPPAKNMDELHRYPSPQQQRLRQLIADFRQVDTQNIFVGNGSDEAIDLLFRIFCQPGQDHIIITPPTYGMYGVSAHIHDIKPIEIPLDDDFQPQVQSIIDRATKKTKILFLCSPNNPTGNLLDRKKIEKLIRQFPGIVVIDEAYIDFSKQKSWVSRLDDHPNLVVLQTMSKSFGLAGLRLGMAFASAPIIHYLMKVKAPYNINRLTSKAAQEAFYHTAEITQHIERIKKQRTRLRNELAKLSMVKKIYPSDANFLLVKMANAKEIYGTLIDENIIVRYRGDMPGCENCLRITVGTANENNEVIEALKKIKV